MRERALGGTVLSTPPKEYVEWEHLKRVAREFNCSLVELHTTVPLDWIQRQTRIWNLEAEVEGRGNKKRRMGPVRMGEDDDYPVGR